MGARGRFVVLEGLDGCGKSTQARRLVERLEALGRPVHHVREPGSTALGERVRALLLDPSLGEISAVAEVLLYQAARAQLVSEVLVPALGAGQDVVCERWHYATSAYQGVAGGAGLETVALTSRVATGALEPDRALLLDLPDAERAARMDRPLDRIEQRGQAYRRRVSDAFRELFRVGGHLRTIDARGSPEEVEARVWEACSDLF